MPLFRILRQILRCLDGSLVNVLYDVLMVRYVTVIRCSDGRQVGIREYGKDLTFPAVRGMAGGSRVGADGIPGDEGIPERRAVWHGIADAPGGGVNTGQHR